MVTNDRSLTLRLEFRLTEAQRRAMRRQVNAVGVISRKEVSDRIYALWLDLLKSLPTEEGSK